MDYSKITEIRKIHEYIHFVDVYLLVFDFKDGTRDIKRYKSATQHYNDYHKYQKELKEYRVIKSKQNLEKMGFVFISDTSRKWK
jgi:hypothetical protein